MIELPEARTIAKDLRKEILGKTVVFVGGNFTDHKFTFYANDPNQYNAQLSNKKVTNIIDRNFYIEIEIENYILLMRDGANIRYYEKEQSLPKKSKLLIRFNDESFINVTTTMYACIGAYKKNSIIDNQYYEMELSGIGALDKTFTFDYFKSLLNDKTMKLSIKAFLATEQRILGIGNGVVQDIMYYAGLNPRRKMNTLSEDHIKNLYHAIIDTLNQMVLKGGRDTEKNIYGENGNYKTVLSKKTYQDGCKKCKTEIKKEQYLGGSIYYCPSCQQ